MRFSMLPQVFSQMFRKPFTNKFPAKYAPASTTNFFKAVAAGKASLIPPIDTPENFRGKIKYDRETCIGCKLCLKVCPSGAIQATTRSFDEIGQFKYKVAVPSPVLFGQFPLGI